MSTYYAINVDLNVTVPFEYGEDRHEYWISKAAKEAMHAAHGTYKIHGWSVSAQEGSDYWDLRERDENRQPFETVCIA